MCLSVGHIVNVLSDTDGRSSPSKFDSTHQQIDVAASGTRVFGGSLSYIGLQYEHGRSVADFIRAANTAVHREHPRAQLAARTISLPLFAHRTHSRTMSSTLAEYPVVNHMSKADQLTCQTEGCGRQYKKFKYLIQHLKAYGVRQATRGHAAANGTPTSVGDARLIYPIQQSGRTGRCLTRVKFRIDIANPKPCSLHDLRACASILA